MRIKAWRDRPWDSPWGSDAATVKAALAITEIGLERGMCYGPCPAYAVSLHRSGEARFTGEHFVDLLGDHVADFASTDFDMLALALVHLGFDRLAPRYETFVTDTTTTELWVVSRGKRHKVRDEGGDQPKEFGVIVELVDAAASELDWRRDGDAPIDTSGLPLFAGLSVDERTRALLDPDERPHWTRRSA